MVTGDHEPPVTTPPFDPVPLFLRGLLDAPTPRADDCPTDAGSVRHAVTAALGRITELGPALGVFTTVLAERALQQADALDRLAADGETGGPLHGTTLAVKDCIDIAGVPTTCGTAGRRNHVAGSTATCVAALEAAGAVVVGKTNMHEWAYGGTSDNPHFGPVRNPWAPERIPGGSSGGSAVAVATGMADLALGTDTGGSVRIPAAYCGVAGLKVTPGRIPLDGVEPLSWTLDTVGLLGATVESMSTAYRVLAGTGRLITPAGGSGATPTIATIPAAFGGDGRVDGAVAQHTAAAVARLQAAGAVVAEHDLPEMATVPELFFPIVLSEAAAVHDGDRRGDRARYGDDIRTALTRGDAVPAIEYLHALRRRPEVAAALVAVLQTADVILAPASAILPTVRGTASITWADGTEEDALLACARYCLPPSFAGLPALVVPCGQDDGIPVGIQLIGQPGGEEHLLAVGGWVERALGATCAGNPEVAYETAKRALDS